MSRWVTARVRYTARLYIAFFQLDPSKCVRRHVCTVHISVGRLLYYIVLYFLKIILFNVSFFENRHFTAKQIVFSELTDVSVKTNYSSNTMCRHARMVDCVILIIFFVYGSLNQFLRQYKGQRETVDWPSLIKQLNKKKICHLHKPPDDIPRKFRGKYHVKSIGLLAALKHTEKIV